MLKVLKIAGLGAGALGVFAGSTALFLMSRGDLNARGLSRIPLVGEIVEAPDEPPPPDPARQEVLEQEGADPRRDTPPSESIFARPGVFERGEIDEILAELREAREAYRAKLASAEGRSEDLDRREEEIRDRRDGLEQMLESVRLGRLELQRERSRFEKDVVRFSQAQASNMKTIATQYESMDPEAAAQAVGELPDDEVVLILSQMSPRKAGKLLQALDPAHAARITERMMGLIAEDPAADPKKE